MFQDYVISASVGRNGANKPNDVIVIQALLKRITEVQGGPGPMFEASGRIDPETQAAIDRFQQHHQLGSDGRIDPGGRMLAKINQLVRESMLTPATPPAVIPPPMPSTRDVTKAVVMGIWGRAGGSDSQNPDNGIAHWIGQLTPKLTALGVPANHIWSMSWNPNQAHNNNPWGTPDTEKHLAELYGREPNPSYVALIGHSYGGRAACLLSQRLNRPPNYVALLDPVFGPMGKSEAVIEPRGDVVQNWFQRNAIVVTRIEDFLGVVASLVPLEISLGRSIPNAENFEVKFRRKSDGTRATWPGTDVPQRISHVTIDGDEFIWSQIIQKIVNDVRNLAA